MTTFVALLRGINVGGRHIVPMQEFRNLLTELGCLDVRTYIQSGNAVFRSTSDARELESEIRDSVEQHFGFAPRVLVLTADQFLDIIASNPFPDAVAEPRFLHVSFFAEPPGDPDLDTLEASKSKSERFALTDSAFFLHAPDGIARSKLAERVEKCLGVATTGRNWNTVTRLADLVAE